MGDYECGKCRKVFSTKGNFISHMKRKSPCYNSKTQKTTFYNCDFCYKIFSRKYNKDKHMKICNKNKNKHSLKNNEVAEEITEEIAKKVTKKVTKKVAKKCNKICDNNDVTITNSNNKNSNNKNSNNKNKKNSDNVINNVNNTYIKCDVLLPFGSSEIQGFSTHEKIKIWTSTDNPLITIILKTNLNAEKPEYHNVGIPDLKSGFGLIYDGKSWSKERINIILNKLYESKKQDLITIYEQIKMFVGQNNEYVKNQLDKIEVIMYPPYGDLNKITSNNFKTNTKKIFYNNRELLEQSMINHPSKNDKITPDEKNNYKNPDMYVKPFCLFDHLENDKDIGEYLHKIEIKLNYAYYLLNISVEENNIENYEEIKVILERIESTNDLNAVIEALTKSAYFGINIDDQYIKNKITREKLNNELFKNFSDSKS